MTAPEKLLRNPGALCNMVKRIAFEAGEIILNHFEEGAGISTSRPTETKPDGSPVTAADRDAERYIHLALLQLLPDVPVIAEEAAAHGPLPDCAQAPYFWLVDPLDGTRGFTEGSVDYTVNIGLVRRGEPGNGSFAEPLIGVVYAPARGVLYAGHGPGTATRWLAENDHEKSIEVRRTPRAGLTMMTSSSPDEPARLDAFLEGFKVEKIIRRASALKICAIAEGKADFYPRFGAVYEWDTAAGDAVLRAAGGLITDMNGQPMTYGHADRAFKTPDFVASAFEWFGVAEE